MIFKSKGQFADDAIDAMKKADTAKVTVQQYNVISVPQNSAFFRSTIDFK